MSTLLPSARESPRGIFSANALLTREAPKDPPTTDLYISQIPCEVDAFMLRELFSRFGQVERVYEGRKGEQTGRMKWAFISYARAEDAQYVLQNVVKIGIGGSILYTSLLGSLSDSSNIRPRDKGSIERERQETSRSERDGRLERDSRPETMRPEAFRPDRLGADNVRPMRMQKPISPRRQTSPRQMSPRQLPRVDAMKLPNRNAYPLLSKTLRVANLPPEYTPKHLFDLFDESGKAEGAFIYAFPDAAGRRVGEVAMATYLYAQRQMDGRYVEGYALEVTYKPANPIGHQGPFHVPPEPVVEYPKALWSPNMSPIHSIPNMHSMTVPIPNTSLPISNPSLPMAPNMFMPPITPPQMAMWPFPTSPTMVTTRPLGPMAMEVPPIQPDSPHITAPPTPPAVAPEPSPPPPYSALPPIPETEDQLQHHPIDLTDGYFCPAPYDPCNLFIKNLDDEVVANQADLESIFSEFGIITSAFLATYAPKDPAHHPVSKGFGFVAFSRPEEADLARSKMHGAMLGKKKLFVSFAERKADRQMRLKALFESMDKLALELRSEVAIKPEQPRPVKPSTTSGYRRGGVRRGRRLRRGQAAGRRVPSEPYMDPSFLDIDFHEDFPPLPKSVKQTQSPTLQKLTEPQNFTEAAQSPKSEPSSPQKLDAPQTIAAQSPQKVGVHNFGARNGHAQNVDVQSPQKPARTQFAQFSTVESPSIATTVPETDPMAGLLILPRAPPPSSAEISTAGNTAPSTPTPKYARPPRMTPQSLHDKLMFANATLATLQESPLLRAAVVGGMGDEMLSLDTTAGTVLVEAAIKEEWVAPLVSAV